MLVDTEVLPPRVRGFLLSRFSPVHVHPFLFCSFLLLFIFVFMVECSFFRLFGPLCFLLGTFGGYVGDDVGMDTAVEDTGSK